MSNYPPVTADIASEPFRVQKLVFFVSARHPLATRRSINLSDVLDFPLVIRGPMSGPIWTQGILKTDFRWRIQIQGCTRMSRANAGKRKCRQEYRRGNFDRKIEADVASGRLVILKGADFQFNMLSYILHSKKRGLSPAALEFLGLLRRAKKNSSRRKVQ